MKTVGQQLKEARLARNWTPELASRETKIKVERLLDLEVDRYSNFSSPAYARGFVRTYARSLGLDEYRIVRQLDPNLPESDHSTLASESGVAYIPEASRKSAPRPRATASLFLTLGLGAALLVGTCYVLFQAYRAGILPNLNRASATAATAPNSEPVLPSEAPTRAQPANGSNAVTAGEGPRAQPVDPVTPVALPVDPAPQLALNTTAPAPATEPQLSPAPAPSTSPRAVAVDPAELAATAALPPPVAGAAPVAAPTAGAAIPAPAPGGYTPPRALPVDPRELAAPPTAPVNPVGAAAPIQAAAVAPPIVATPSNENNLVLSASRDSFLRVTVLDEAAGPRVLFASVIRAGQTLGFAGRRFSVNIGLPKAVAITLDGVKYGPRDEEEPETFTLESTHP